MLTILVLVFILALGWIILQPEWLPKPPENKVTETVVTGGDKAISASRGLFGWLRRKKPQISQSELFKKWAAEYNNRQESAAVGWSEFLRWFEGLNSVESAAFVKNLSDFCQTTGFNLTWLWDTRVKGDSRKDVEQTAIYYSMAVWKGAGLRAYIAYKTWETFPAKKENQVYGQKLIQKLTEQGLVNIPPEMMLASEKERLAFLIGAAQNAELSNQTTFNHVIKAVMDELSAEEPNSQVTNPAPVVSGEIIKPDEEAAVEESSESTEIEEA